MNAGGVWFLGRRYLGRNRAKTALLVAAFSLVWLLPAGIALVVGKVEEQLRARAAGTPLLLGQAGSPLELVFNGLYFTKPAIATLPYGGTEAIAADGLATVIPLYARYAAADHRIVGTTLDYFDFRGLEIREGRGLIDLGECVVGSGVAAQNGIVPGDSVISTPETLFDLAGVYPLKMKVVGVLAPSGTPDDAAIFVDLKTAWIIEGLGHGHEEADKLGEEARLAALSGSDDGAVRLNASVVQYNEVTEENVDDFHFHGEIADYPVTAAIVIPVDAKAQALLKGRYGKAGGPQLISPGTEMDELFATVFSVQDFVLRLLGAIGVATLAIGALVFLLSNRLRRDEFRHLRHLGADPGTVRALVLFEGAFVVVTSLMVAGAGLAILRIVAPILVRQWLA
jgi:putative ABC transport system permease protein